MSLKNNTSRVYWCILVVMLILHLYGAFRQQLISDEFETIATARFIAEGKIIYKDFFQHHGPLSYSIYSIVFFFARSIGLAICCMKIISFIVLSIIVVLLMRMARYIVPNDEHRQMGFWSAFLLLNDAIWWRYGTQVRPDGMMVAALLLVFYFFLRYQKKQSTIDLLFAGFFASAAFFCKQSSIIILGIFLVCYFRGRIKHYIVFLCGALPLSLFLLWYFSQHQALPAFWRYYLHFNYSFFPSANFTLRERLWFFFSPVIPLTLKLLYSALAVVLVFFFARFFRRVKETSGAFFLALVCAFFGSVIVTLCWKTPYPQYYMPLQILLLLLCFYYGALFMSNKWMRFSVPFGLFLCMPLVSYSFFTAQAFRESSFCQQVSALEAVSKVIPGDARMMGALPFSSAYDPAGFFWYYPPLFIDTPMHFLKENLTQADAVFYDSSFYLLAPSEVKNTLLGGWYFVGRYSFPFSNQGMHEPIALFVKHKDMAQEITRNLDAAFLRQASISGNLFGDKSFIPVYCAVEVWDRGVKRELLGRGTHEVLNAEGKINIRIKVSSRSDNFNEITNHFFPDKPRIQCASGNKKVSCETLFKESMRIDLEKVLGWRARTDNQPLLRGMITVSYDTMPSRAEVKQAELEYEYMLTFAAERVIITIEAVEKLM
ncbi:MAG: glycosyltransferase family 39 protein [Candidatus Omnitrophica bacterium]|nr:glycosyltransferase family 39 protein [Candidatus Omnitrophota bacterium]